MSRDKKEEVRLLKVIQLQKASNKLQEETNELLKENIKLQKEALRLKKETTGLGEGFYEVEEIRQKKTIKGKPHYFIKWLGWPEEFNTWEPRKNLQECLDIVDAFEKSLRSGAQGEDHKREGTSQPNKPRKRCKPQSAAAADHHNCVQNVCETLAKRSEPSLSEKVDMVLGEEGLEEQSDAFVCEANLANSVDPDPKVLTNGSPSTKQLTDADDAVTAGTKAANDKESSINQQSLCHGNQSISCIPHDPGKLDLLKDDRGFTFKVTSPTSQPNDVFQAGGTTPIMSSLCRTDPCAVEDAQTSGKVVHIVHAKECSIRKPILPDLNTSDSTPALLEHPMTDLQQVQLRAQIFVYGDLLTGTSPDEACMIYAFGESDGGQSVWESVWRVFVSQHQNSPLSSAKLPAHETRRLFQDDTYSTPDQAGGVRAPLKMLSPLVQELGIKQIEKAQSYSVTLERKNKELQEELKASKQQLEYAQCENKVLQVKLKAREEELESVLGENNVLREELERKAINHGAQ